jgi:hypothetical protein
MCDAKRSGKRPSRMLNPGSPTTATIGNPDKLGRKLVVSQTIIRLWSRHHHTVVPL